ncbi:hypothetical protein [Erwinia sp. E_sp_B04_7]|uniref:hypothetical protein n=1 Tax=unclassified Erwinia TaxID=2622719 RepID=UPI0030CF6CF3
MPANYFYVTQQTDQMGFYMLHRAECPVMPPKETLTFIGSLYNGSQALTVAQVRFGKKVKACYHCCRKQENALPLSEKLHSRHHSDN